MISGFFRHILGSFLRFYKLFVSPLFGPRCRFHPTCSEYFVSAVERHGIRGVGLGIYRIFRCNPYCKGGDDPVP